MQSTIFLARGDEMRRLIFLLFFPFFVSALEVQPWFGGLYEFHLQTGYMYDYYRSVEGAVVPLGSTSNDHHLFWDLDFHAAPSWDCDIDLHLIDTPRHHFGFETTAIQMRYQWLDDIVGDPITLATGFSARYVSDVSLRDVSSLYHGPAEFVINFGLGNEFVDNDQWRARIWFYGAFGQATFGSPWLEGLFGLDANVHEMHKFSIFFDGLHGFGRRHSLNIEHFHGYGKIYQRSIDIALRYGYQFGVWGTVKFTYERRLLAKLCPKNVNSFEISYLFPFSF